MSRIGRREFLFSTGAAVTAGAIVGPLAAQGVVGVRKDVTSPQAAADLADYRAAVAAMRQLGMANKLSWQFQATIHRDRCPHGNWYFLPWHRAYLWEFEKICRKLIDKPTFMLPYWNWTTTPAIPSDFWGQSNSLNDPSREIDASTEMPAEHVGQRAIDEIMAIADFVTFGSKPAAALRPNPPVGGTGQLEGTPHNHVHGMIGGDMGGYMSPLDPIFWLHHANIDRLWAMWASDHSDPADEQWLNLGMDFVDQNGNAVQVKPIDLLITRDLGYRYDTQPELLMVGARVPRPVAAMAPDGFRGNASFNLGNSTRVLTPLNVPLPPELRRKMSFLPTNPEGQRPATFRLRIADVSPPPDEKEPVSVRVFLNCGYLTPQTRISDPHYVGTFSFFGERHVDGGRMDEARETERFLDATRTLRRLYGGRQYPFDNIRVSLITVATRTGKPKDYFLAPKAVAIEAVD